MHQCNRFALGEIPPPPGRNRPKTETDFAHRQLRLLVSAIAHCLNRKLPTRSPQHPNTEGTNWTLDIRRPTLGSKMTSKSNSALLIVGHGSTVNSDSSAPTLTHAAEIRRRKLFAEVGCAFWKEEPSLRDALFLFDPESIREVYLVPNFISEGYFTQTVIPR